MSWAYVPVTRFPVPYVLSVHLCVSRTRFSFTSISFFQLLLIFSCPVCGVLLRCLMEPSSLSQLSFQCLISSKSFNSKRALGSHQKAHTRQARRDTASTSSDQTNVQNDTSAVSAQVILSSNDDVPSSSDSTQSVESSSNIASPTSLSSTSTAPVNVDNSTPDDPITTLTASDATVHPGTHVAVCESLGTIPDPNGTLTPNTESTDAIAAPEANFVWGDVPGIDFINKLNLAYSEVVYFRQNLFKLPSGSAGKEYLKELIKLLSDWNTNPLYTVLLGNVSW